MNIEIQRPRGSTVIVDLGQFRKVSKQYQAYLTLAPGNWPKIRLDMWKQLQKLEQKTDSTVSINYADPREMECQLRSQLETQHSRRNRTRKDFISVLDDQIMAALGKPNQEPKYRNTILHRLGAGNKNVNERNRILDLRVIVKPHDLAAFVNDITPILKKYYRKGNPKRSWSEQYPIDWIIDRYFRMIDSKNA